jgi:hypothetical protein
MSNFLKVIESKAFAAGILGTVAAFGAVYGFNVPVATIMALMTPFMIGIGGLGWSDAVKMKAKMQLEHEMKMHALIHGNTVEGGVARDADGKCVARPAQAGFAKIGVMMGIAALVGALAIGSTLIASDTGCATVQPVVTDVIDCAKAEAVVVSDGFSIVQIVAEVYAAIQGGPAGVLAAVEDLIKKYGGDIVACALDNYPEPTPAPTPGPGSGSGSAAPVVASASPATLAKHAALEKYFPGKKISHTNFKKR